MYEGDDGVLAGITAGKCLVDCATLTPEHMVSAVSCPPVMLQVMVSDDNENDDISVSMNY